MWDEHHKDVLVMWAKKHAIVFMLSIIIVTWIVWYGILVTAGYAMSYDLCPLWLQRRLRSSAGLSSLWKRRDAA